MLILLFFWGFFLVSRKQKLDVALVDMIVLDAQPFSIVEDKGFKVWWQVASVYQ